MNPKRSGPWAALCLASALAVPASVLAQGGADLVETTPVASELERIVEFDIAPQPLSAALIRFADQSGIQVVTAGEEVSRLNSAGVNGALPAREALIRLLAGTGFDFVAVGASTVALTAPARGAGADYSRHGGIEEVIVTGQKRAERLQDVPIAISAFSMEALDQQKIEGGFDLLKAIPNVTFSKTNFTGYNFQIRGIGTQAVSATTDPGVAVSMNNTTLIVNRLFEQEYLDIERVEVLRGPQGTLYGRNATAGVINVITAKPVMGEQSGEVKLEAGNYSANRLRGYYNLPLSDTLAARIAYASTKRDGFAYNQFDGGSIDSRDLWTGRVSLGWEPSERLRVNLMWERFEEDDQRVRSTKQLCHRDEGTNQVAGYDISTHSDAEGVRRVLNQGCLPKGLYSYDAFQTPNGDSLPFVSGGRDNGWIILAGFSGILGYNPYSPMVGGDPSLAPCPAAARDIGIALVNPCVDVFAHRYQSTDLRSIYSAVKPIYRADADIYDLSLDFQWTDELLFSSQTVYVTDDLYSTQDYGRFKTSPGMFNDISGPMMEPMFQDFVPNGIFCDPQLGCSDTLRIQDVSRASSRQFNQEFRLVSDFQGSVNFSLGANYTRFETVNDYFVMSNLMSALAMSPPFNGSEHPCGISGGTVGCVYVDPNPLHSINGEGHNYFRSANPYRMNSAGVFGEMYWNITDALKLTAGVRYTWDRKTFTPIPSQTLLADYRENDRTQLIVRPGQGPEACMHLVALCGIHGDAPGGRGYPAQADIVQTWREPTGRIVLDWQPDLAFTDETLLYGSYSRGYKAGGANPPGIAAPAGIFIDRAMGAVVSRTFEPEYVNAYEIGAKNTLFGGALMLNGAAFYYDYEGYQVSKIVNRSAANENFDATVWGLELEALFVPSLNWQFNAAIGYLRTRVADGERSIDLMDRAQQGQAYQTTIRNPHFGADPATVSGIGANQTENEFLVFDDWLVLKPNPTQTSNCVAPAELVREVLENGVLMNGEEPWIPAPMSFILNQFCPGGHLVGGTFQEPDGITPVGKFDMRNGMHYDPAVDAPNGGAGFSADIGGKQLPNSPRMTAAIGAQFSFDIGRDWRAATRLDYYWQDRSYARVYNTEYDRLREWSNTNLSVWATHERLGLTIEAYVKNLFAQTPITGTFLNSDDTGLTTNVFTLDPRLVGVSLTKRF